MALKDKLTSGIKKAGKKIDNYLSPGKLEKMRIMAVNQHGQRSRPMTVQFNPSEYHITRGVTLSEKQGVGQQADPEKIQAVKGGLATLSVSFYFDTITDLYSLQLTQGWDWLRKGRADPKGHLAKAAKSNFLKTDHDDPDRVCDEIMSMVKFAQDDHAPKRMQLVWGDLDFLGYVQSSSVTYTMFDPAGTPVRAKVDITVQGEEFNLSQTRVQMPPESPDRTKERTLAQGDQLWMLAGEEYDDPAQWKQIARANGILNPRKTADKAVRLKVPAIK